MTDGRPLRVGFFMTDDPGGHSGIDRYTSDLLRELAQRDDLTIVPIASPRAAEYLLACLTGITDVVVTTGSQGLLRSVEERYGLGRKLVRARLDILHGTKHILPIRAWCPRVLTVHDLFPLTRGRDYGRSKRLLLPIVYRRSLSQADRIIVMTQSLRRQVVASGSLDDHKVDVVPTAPSTALTRAATEVLPSLAGSPFAFCIGDLSPRKNVDLLLRIWPTVHRETGVVLALVGPDRSRDERMRARIGRLQRVGIVVRTGAVSDGAVRWCYEHAEVVLIPSLEEGCGFPAIEARHFGAKLITSNDAALVEVSGDAALHVDASDDQGWIRAIAALVTPSPEPPLAAVLATWPEVAALTAQVYRRAVGVSK